MSAKTLAVCIDGTHYLNKFQRLPNEHLALLECEPFGLELALDGIYDRGAGLKAKARVGITASEAF